MLDAYKEVQPFAYQIIKNEINNNKISHAYMIEANGYHDTLGFAKAMVKTLFCVNIENKEEIINLIDGNNFPEFRVIDPDGLVIKKEEIDALQYEFSKKPIYSTRKIYIINNANRLNSSSANALLKFLEEPNQDIIAILIANNVYEVMETIISRCQILSLKEEVTDLKKLELKERLLYSLNKSEGELLNIFEVDNIGDALYKEIDFINYYEKHKMDTIINVNKLWFSYYNTKEKFDIAFQIMILYYVDVLRYISGINLIIFDEYMEKIEDIFKNYELENISSKIKIIVSLNKKVRQNNNLNLIMDKLLIEFGRCDNIG